MHRLRRLLLFLSVLLLAGCRNITGAAGSGTYTADVTGAFTASYSGRMIYEPRSVTAGAGYNLHLKLPNDLFNGILFQLPGRPHAGTYQVVPDRGQELDDEEVFGGLLLPDVIYHASTGELRVTRTSPLRGTFQFEARRNGGVVTISGEFAEE
jgi:hypothetical protein